MSSSTPPSNEGNSPQAPSSASPGKGASGPSPKLVVGTIVFGVALFFGLNYVVENWSREATDDAFIDGHVVAIASRVSGQVLATKVVENQTVKAGDTLVELDPQDYEVKASQKNAAVLSAAANEHAILAGFELMRAKVTTAEATQKQSVAEAEAAKATYENAEANWNRAQNLWTNHDVMSAQDHDSAKAAANAAKANWQADVEKAASDASKVIEARAQLTTAEKLYEQAEAQVSQAQSDLKAVNLELSYTKVLAPVDGQVTRKMVEKGAYVQTGQTLMAVVRPEIWITANFKETQTARIRAGQPVRITVDGGAKHELTGKVESVQAGSGARFSLLPPENAVGNYVKVVQRVPVRIRFDDTMEAIQGLGPGMSVVPSVELGSRPASELVVAVGSVVLALLGGGFAWFMMQRRSKEQKPA